MTGIFIPNMGISGVRARKRKHPIVPRRRQSNHLACYDLICNQCPDSTPWQHGMYWTQ